MEYLLLIGLVIFGVWYFNQKRGVKPSGPKSQARSAPTKRRLATHEPSPVRPGRRADLGMLPPQFVVFDLETTGLDPDRHEIIEFGAIRVNRDSDAHETFQTLVIPQGRISAKITELTGIDRKMTMADGIPIEEALDAFKNFVGDLPLVSFNTDFDLPFLHNAAVRAERQPFANRSSCALKMAREAWPGKRSYRLTALCDEAGIVVHDEHRALPDCERAMRVYVAAAQTLGRP